MGFWSSIDSLEKRERWAFIGGGLVTAAAAAWAVFVYLNPPKSVPASGAPTVSAAGSSVAIGGNVSGSTIYAAPGPQQQASKTEAGESASGPRR